MSFVKWGLGLLFMFVLVVSSLSSVFSSLWRQAFSPSEDVRRSSFCPWRENQTREGKREHHGEQRQIAYSQGKRNDEKRQQKVTAQSKQKGDKQEGEKQHAEPLLWSNSTPLTAQAERVWTHIAGKWSFAGTLVGMEGRKVELKKSFGGTSFTVSLNELSKADCDYFYCLQR